MNLRGFIGYSIIIVFIFVIAVITIPIRIDRVPLLVDFSEVAPKDAKTYGLLYQGLPDGWAQVGMRGYLIPENKTMWIDFPINEVNLITIPHLFDYEVKRGVEIHFFDKHGDFIEKRFLQVEVRK